MQNNQVEMSEIAKVEQVQRQVQLEQEARQMGYQRLMKAVEKNGLESTGVGEQFILRAVKAMAAGINEWVEKAKTNSRKNGDQLKLFTMFDPEELSYLTLRVLLGGAHTNQSRDKAFETLGEAVINDLEMRNFMRVNKRAYEWTAEYVKKYSSASQAKSYMRRIKSEKGIKDEYAEHFKKLKIGQVLFDLAQSTTGYFSLDHDCSYSSKNRRLETAVKLSLNPEYAQTIEEMLEKVGMHSPVLAPMVCKPFPWTNTTDGGYISIRKSFVLGASRSLLAEMNTRPEAMAKTYAAANTLQETEYCINMGVLSVLKQLRGTGMGVAGLPSFEPPMAPAKPHDMDTNELAKKSWKKERALQLDDWNRDVSKRSGILSKITWAEKLKDETLYMPHVVDFRGRLYPLNTILSPQGDDSSKALLLYKEGKRLGQEGVQWLLVHIANVFGYDKVSYDERVEWVHEHANEILDSAIFPVDGQQFWMTADKPFQALAACIDFAGYVMDGEDHVSHLPIAMDGTCNGLQHISALLRDEKGGALVGLVPSDKPTDIYTKVAQTANSLVDEYIDSAIGAQVKLTHLGGPDIIKERIRAAKAAAQLENVRKGLELDNKRTKAKLLERAELLEQATKWVDEDGVIHTQSDEFRMSKEDTALFNAYINSEAAIFFKNNGGITRKLVKRGVMTMPYGVTARGRVDQIVEVLKKQGIDGELPKLDKSRLWQYANFVSTLIQRALDSDMKKSADFLSWLKGVAKAATTLPESGKGPADHLKWQSPSGFIVVQRYNKYTNVRKRFVFDGGHTHNFTVSVPDSSSPDHAKAVQGIVPNFIHSLDAAALVYTLEGCREEGISSFTAVHDSYATHAANAGLMQSILREKFVELHNQDCLASLLSQIQSGTPDGMLTGVSAKIPAIMDITLPEYGTLDMEGVLASNYFFA